MSDRKIHVARDPGPPSLGVRVAALRAGAVARKQTDAIKAKRGAPVRPRLLDLFCCAGGAAKGYYDAGFDVVGVDIEPQPNYPFEFHQADALTFPLLGFDAYHASAPCQWATAYGRRPNHVGEYQNLIEPIRERLEATGKPYVIENVEYARDHLRNPVRLCGSSFGLDIRRHRLFECSFPVMAPPCDHSWQTPRFPAATNRKPNSRRTVEIGVWRIPLAVQQEAMGIYWTTLHELSEAIPPAYTEHIGCYLMVEVKDRMMVPEMLRDALEHPEKHLSAEEIAEYERCQQSIVDSAIWVRP